MYRKERINEQLLALLAEEIRRMRDPRVDSVSVTSIELSPDCRYARVFWSCYLGTILEADGDRPFLQPGQIDEINGVLHKAAKFLKHKISGQLKLRHIPELIFEYDQSIQTASRIDSLLQKVGS